MTAAEYANLERLADAYDWQRARWHATRDDPHSLRHHAARILADDARAAYGAARIMARSATAR